MDESTLIVVACLALVSIAALEASPTESLHSQWTHFKAQYGKQYASAAEEAERLELFAENKLKVDKFNLEQSAEAGYTLAVNHLSDRTDEEFRQLLGFMSSAEQTFLRSNSDSDRSSKKGGETEPDSLDWRQAGRVTPVKDQKKCGSDWAFAVVGVLEGQELTMKQIEKPISLSVQNVMDCGNYSDAPCDGGDPMRALYDIAKKGGLESEADYPYLASKGSCNFNESRVVIANDGFLVLPPGNEQILKEYVFSSGPLSAVIEVSDGGNFRHYKSGVYTDEHCRKDSKNLNHAVLIVGYGTDPKEGDYWIVKNSWSATWGDEGYIKMARNKKNMCGIATYVLGAVF